MHAMPPIKVMHATCRFPLPGRQGASWPCRVVGALAFSAALYTPGLTLAAPEPEGTPAPIAIAIAGQQYGAGATLDGAQALSIVMAVAQPESTTAVKVRGTVSAVCQRKGCWLDLSDESSDQPLRVAMRGHSFFVPSDLVGATVVIVGDLARKDRTVAERQHLAEDAGKSPQEIDAIREPETTWNLVAYGLLVLEPSPLLTARGGGSGAADAGDSQ